MSDTGGPKIGEQVKDHLKKKGNDPHFSSEKTLYKFQSQVLDLAGPLSCLWADLLNADIKVKREDIILMVQQILVLVGSVSNSITQEWRQISWSRLNPLVKDIMMEEDSKGKKGATLFGGGFMEKANKRIEDEKALSKVTGTQRETPSAKCQRYSQDPTDLHRFLNKGATAQYGGRKHQCQQLYSQNHNPKGGQNHKYSQQHSWKQGKQ